MQPLESCFAQDEDRHLVEQVCDVVPPYPFHCSAKLARFWAEPLKLHVKPLADEWNHQINKIIYPTGHVNSLAMHLVAHLSHQQRPANTTSIRPTSPMLEV